MLMQDIAGARVGPGSQVPLWSVIWSQTGPCLVFVADSELKVTVATGCQTTFDTFNPSTQNAQRFYPGGPVFPANYGSTAFNSVLAFRLPSGHWLEV